MVIFLGEILNMGYIFFKYDIRFPYLKEFKFHKINIKYCSYLKKSNDESILHKVFFKISIRDTYFLPMTIDIHILNVFKFYQKI